MMHWTSGKPQLSLFVAIVLAVCLARHGRGEDTSPPPLVLTPENTVILNRSVYAGPFLQHYLIKYLVDRDLAEKYTIDAKIDRAASPAFPLLQNKDAELPKAKNVIAVGATQFLSPEDRERLESQERAVLIKRQGNVIVVAGAPLSGSWDGTFFAISRFLDLCCGVRFYGPEDPWISAPGDKRIVVDELDVFEPWPFYGLQIGFIERNREWLRMNGNRGTMRATHNLARVFPPERYGKTHPEIYEMKSGERRVPSGPSWNPCLSAKALPDLAMEYVRERMARRPTSRDISFGVMDCAFDYECPDCQASVKKHKGSYSNLYYAFLNEVARRCREEFPGLYLTAYVYSNVRTPPVGMRIEPNIVVDVVTKSYRFVEPEWVAHEKGRIKAFSDLGASWAIHDWCFSDVSPRSYMRQFGLFLQWAAQNGMVGAVVEISKGENWYLEGPKYWVLMQLMQDPYRDVDLMYRQYCDDMYGPAAETMYRFFRHFDDKYVYARKYIELNDLPRQEPALYSEDDLRYQRDLLEQAIALTGDDVVIRQRLAKVMRYFSAHELWARAVYEPQRLHYAFQGDGLNVPALQFYLQDDGKRLAAAMDYYLTKRTLPPDDNSRNRQLGIFESLITNYTRGKEAALDALRNEALAGVDLAAADRATAQRVVKQSLAVLHKNLPTEYNQQQLKEFETILRKVIFIPRVETAPKIDGDLSDAVWRQGTVLADFTQRDTLAPSPHPTEGRVLRVGDHLAFALKCCQKGPINAWTPADVTAGSLSWKESGVEFFFGTVATDENEAPCAQYMVNSLGAFNGYKAARNNREGATFTVKVDEPHGLYTIEALLPLKAEGYDFTTERVLSFNLMRKANTKVGRGTQEMPDSVSGWYPIFLTPHKHESRGIVVVE